ncbi:cupin domain-containing protein [Natronolimnohabitans innermongolicus]|uniref:Pectin degradation protein n=1 Tax=Natronolimnohabitans innermongolicus JCM 12255 TaxID=1227499 RepID=L9WYH1_9EURY|nr:cupin domain-containing protein [Natronolimnohabitans innermongolicus]ELY54467.1 pectin degradation protein [Natronolimnohabitans innermongolicus JCM 12255]
MPREYDRSEIPSVHTLQHIEPYRDEPGFEQALVRGIDQLIGFSRISPEKPDGEPHTHPYEQMNVLVEGRLDFLVDGERVELEPYDTLVIPPEIPHTSRAVDGETATLLAFWPLREDRLDATTYQTEFPDL